MYSTVCRSESSIPLAPISNVNAIIFLTFPISHFANGDKLKTKIIHSQCSLLLILTNSRNFRLYFDVGRETKAVRCMGVERNKEQIFDLIPVCISFKTVFDFLVCYERNLNSSPHQPHTDVPFFSIFRLLANDMHTRA